MLVDTSEQAVAVGLLERPAPADLAPPSTYRRLLDLFHQGDIAYRLMDHPPEGQTTLASELRGHKLSAAAKCMVVTVTKGGQPTRHLLAVVPGDRRVDLKQVARVAGGGKARFAGQDVAELLGATVSGTITPFSFHPDLQVLADPALFDEPELYFNAARLDRSVAIRSADYRRLARPQIIPIT
ncbi:YbaK/EbsC family protein [Kitasatospora sp. NPDC050463]|uniref:YbaK/EbsC family protein n=1 Tax=Kitasatospora sp. NPDC050463 TaxID=3155786 RepID=UPI0033CFE484